MDRRRSGIGSGGGKKAMEGNSPSNEASRKMNGGCSITTKIDNLTLRSSGSKSRVVENLARNDKQDMSSSNVAFTTVEHLEYQLMEAEKPLQYSLSPARCKRAFPLEKTFLVTAENLLIFLPPREGRVPQGHGCKRAFPLEILSQILLGLQEEQDAAKDGGGMDDRPDQDPIVPSSQAM
ncbi:hypothetical protein MA16_Dca001636 [Dendrobium catenatum]|uniref:Uncharacterized protein n=1 Tax=Dendrobium catenatum TaxID=906689 RepID=A0A2I0WMZ0_9ASPA|nr:hypothetical protein MA16_Dca001636 [Dendrobium catenatum]